MTDVIPGIAVPMLKSPDDTRAWKPITVAGNPAYVDPQGVTWVRARDDEQPQLVIVFTRVPGMRPLPLVPASTSGTVARSERKARRQQRELARRGYTT